MAREGVPFPGIRTLARLGVSLFETNCYLVRTTQDELCVVDPGGDAETVVAEADKVGGTLTYILCTHAHIDHVEAAGELKAARGGRIVLHRADLPLWERLDAQAMVFGLPAPARLPAPDLLLEGDATLPLGEDEIRVLHVPGHSPGSVAYHFPEARVVFNGDTVFAMGVGRTDLFGGDTGALRDSIANKLLTLDDDVLLYSGHGPEVAVADARQCLAWFE